MTKRYWLMKSEPDCFSFYDLMKAPEQTTFWDGVRNYQARNLLRDDVKPGDGVLFYHSGCAEPGVAGIARVASGPYPDATQFDPKTPYFDPKATREQPRWYLVDVAFERKLAQVIALDEIKQHADELGEGFALTARGNRLSVFPVTAAQWKLLLSLEKKPT